MAISVTQLNAELDAQGTRKSIHAIKHFPNAGGTTSDLWYVVGGGTGTGTLVRTKKARWCTTTRADSASDQAVAVRAAMAAP